MGAVFDTWQPLPTVAAKTRGEVPPVGSGLGHGASAEKLSTVVKRSFRRAAKRVLDHGYCWYRGRCLTVQDIPSTLIDQVKTRSSVVFDQKTPYKLDSRPKQVHANFSHAPAKRINTVVWNPGGLSSAKLHEYIQWANQQDISIHILPETRWTFDSQWTDKHWHFLHCGLPKHRGSGILVMISRRICDAASTGYHSILPGRLLHIRLHLQPRYVDVVAIYQCAGHGKADLPTRASVWDAFDNLLSRLANRHGLIVAGDMNCSLTVGYPHTGCRHFSLEWTCPHRYVAC